MGEEITCAICQKSLDNVKDVVILREKGSEGINRASRERNDIIQTVPGQKVNQTCRCEYCHPSYINRAKKKERGSSISSRRSLDRKTEQSFNFKTDCFFCGTNVDLEDQKRRQGDVFRVTTLETKHTVLQTCFERKEEWAEVVRTRILRVHDLPAADAIYHQACNVNFRTKKQIPMQFASEQSDVKKEKLDAYKMKKKMTLFSKWRDFSRKMTTNK